MKLFRKIRQALIDTGDLKRYLLYAIGEILLVMLGILLAFQVNNWNTKRIEKNTELGYYQNIKGQILDDLQVISGQMEDNISYLAQYELANQIIEANDRSKIDTLGYIVYSLIDYSDFDRQGNIYESMVNSGEIKLLDNYEIIEGLRRLEETYIYINRMENIHLDFILQFVVPDLQSSIKYSTRKVEKPDKLFTFEFQNLILTSLRIIVEKDEIYNRALGEIETIIELIDEELNSKKD